MAMSPRLLRPRATGFNPRLIPGLALWLDASDTSSLYTTDAGAVTAVSAPTDIAGCALWLDASDSSTITHTGGAVSEWRDKTTNGRHYTASTTARPSTGTRTQNGLNVIDFDGVNHQMSGNAASLSLFRNVSSGHVFVVAKMDTTAANPFIFSSSTASASHLNRAQVFVDGSGNLSIGGRRLDADGFQYVTVPSVPTVPTVLSAHFDWASSDLFFRRDGVVVSSLTTFQTDGATSDTNSLASALGGAGAGFRMDGYIAEIIVFNAAITSAQRASVEAYLAARWGISGVHAPATATSDPVGAWLDKSGNARHATQSTGANRPTISANTQGGKKMLGFDGANGRLTISFPVTAADPVSMIAVARRGATTWGGGGGGGYGSFLNSTGGSSGGPQLRVDTGNIEVIGGTNKSTTLGSNVGVGSCAIIEGMVSSLATSLYVQGALVDSDAGAGSITTAGTRTSIGAFNDGTQGGGPLNGDIAELICYRASLSTSQRQKLERYLAAKWGITLAPQVSNADAQDWITRVYANGGTVSASTAAAVNQFCNDIDSAGIRDRFYRLGLFAGTGLNAALVPLYRGPSLSGTQYGGTTDTNVGPFVSGDYVETGASGGLTGNGSSKYLNTGVPGNAMTVANRHLSAYEITRDTGTYKALMGTQDNAGGTYFYSLANVSPGTSLIFHCGPQATLASQSSGAHWIGSDQAASAMSLYKNGVSSATSSGTSKNTPSVQPVLVFALNQLPGSVSAAGHSSSRLGGYSMGLALSDSQAAAYYTAMQAFQAALGRNI